LSTARLTCLIADHRSTLRMAVIPRRSDKR
jgi:hypothetical protein